MQRLKEGPLGGQCDPWPCLTGSCSTPAWGRLSWQNPNSCERLGLLQSLSRCFPCTLPSSALSWLALRSPGKLSPQKMQPLVTSTNHPAPTVSQEAETCVRFCRTFQTLEAHNYWFQQLPQGRTSHGQVRGSCSQFPCALDKEFLTPACLQSQDMMEQPNFVHVSQALGQKDREGKEGDSYRCFGLGSFGFLQPGLAGIQIQAAVLQGPPLFLEGIENG